MRAASSRRPAQTQRHDHRRGLRGLERRRRRGQRRARAPGRDLGSRADRGDRRRGLLRLPGQQAGDPADRRGDPGAGVAVDADLALPSPRREPRHRVDARRGAQHALAHLLRRAVGDRRQAQRADGRHPGCAAGRHPAHPPGPGVGRGLLPRLGEGIRARGDPLRGADGHRRSVPGRVRRRPASPR